MKGSEFSHSLCFNFSKSEPCNCLYLSIMLISQVSMVPFLSKHCLFQILFLVEFYSLKTLLNSF